MSQTEEADCLYRRQCGRRHQELSSKVQEVKTRPEMLPFICKQAESPLVASWVELDGTRRIGRTGIPGRSASRMLCCIGNLF